MDFEVRHIDGTTVKLISNEHKCAITSATQTRKLCGNDTVTINLQSATYLDFQVGDTIVIFGQTYTMNQLPTVKKESKRSYSYTLVFEGLQYTLIDRVFLMPDNTQGDNLMFDLAGMLVVLDDNINRGNSGKPYVFDLATDLQTTEYKNLSLTDKNCLAVLQQLCQEWDTEFVFKEEANQITIKVGKAGTAHSEIYEYGRGGGVYELNREKGATDICTRLFVYGGTQNLTYYRHNRLCLPSKTKNQSYVEDATAQATYGIKEQVKNFDEIYPNRIGTVSSISGCDYYEFIDSRMGDEEYGFDLNEKWPYTSAGCQEWLALKGLEDTQANREIYYNDVARTATRYLMAVTAAKIHFNTGQLAGYELDLHSYDHTTHKFTVKPLVDENGYEFPSKTGSAFKIAAGDEYVILDINLPQIYKTEAENKLQTEANTYFATVCRPQPKYNLQINSIALERIKGSGSGTTEIFNVGDTVKINDTASGVEQATIRIDQFTRNLLDVYDYKLTLTDEITYTQQVRTLIEVEQIKRVIEESKIYDVNRIRRGYKTVEEMYNMVFDTEGHIYGEKIQPLSIDTKMLKVGARSQQMVLQNVTFIANYLNNGTSFRVESNGGVLNHYTIDEPNIKTWNISSATFTNLATTGLYVYAKCSRSTNSGQIYITPDQVVFDSDANYWYFLVGTLSSVETITYTSGATAIVRTFAATYGFSAINGRTIRTGVIQSADGATYFDLDNGTITGKIRFLSNGTPVDASTYVNNEVNTAVSELEIGGRNLLYNSSISQNFDKWTNSGAVISNGVGSITGALATTKYVQQDLARLLVSGRTYTFTYSGEIAITSSSQKGTTNYYISPYIEGTLNGSWYGGQFVSFVLDGVSQSNALIDMNAIKGQGYKKFKYTFKYNGNATAFKIYMYGRDYTGVLYFRNLKLEYGTVATDWTPAPEDAQYYADIQRQQIENGTKYLTDAMEAARADEGEIEGGLILGTFIGVRNNGVLAAALNGGAVPNEPMIQSGMNVDPTNMPRGTFRVYQDGRVQLHKTETTFLRINQAALEFFVNGKTRNVITTDSISDLETAESTATGAGLSSGTFSITTRPTVKTTVYTSGGGWTYSGGSASRSVQLSGSGITLATSSSIFLTKAVSQMTIKEFSFVVRSNVTEESGGDISGSLFIKHSEYTATISGADMNVWCAVGLYRNGTNVAQLYSADIGHVTNNGTTVSVPQKIVNGLEAGTYTIVVSVQYRAETVELQFNAGQTGHPVTQSCEVYSKYLINANFSVTATYTYVSYMDYLYSDGLFLSSQNTMWFGVDSNAASAKYGLMAAKCVLTDRPLLHFTAGTGETSATTRFTANHGWVQKLKSFDATTGFFLVNMIDLIVDVRITSAGRDFWVKFNPHNRDIEVTKLKTGYFRLTHDIGHKNYFVIGAGFVDATTMTDSAASYVTMYNRQTTTVDVRIGNDDTADNTEVYIAIINFNNGYNY